MALIKAIEYKGFNPEYWAITASQWQKADNRTVITLEGFKDEETRKASLTNSLPGLTRQIFIDGNVDVATAYEKITESKPQTVITKPEQPAVYEPQTDEKTGDPLEPKLISVAVPAETEEQETNFFADAKSA